MATTYPTNVSSVDSPLSEGHVVHTTQLTLKYAFGLLAIIAGADKFTNFITVWEQYLNPALLNIVPLTAVRFMQSSARSKSSPVRSCFCARASEHSS